MADRGAAALAERLHFIVRGCEGDGAGLCDACRAWAKHVLGDRGVFLLALIDAAPTVVPDDARLRAIIEQRLADQVGSDDDWSAIDNAIALAVDDIMEYLGAKATE